MKRNLRFVIRQARFKKIVSIGFFAVFFTVFLSAGTVQAGFRDWFGFLNKTDNSSQQQAAVVANAVQQYTLKVKISGAGKITISGGSNVVSCKNSINPNGKIVTSGDCKVKFNEGESVTLTPSTPSAKYEFATWAKDCRSSQKISSCTITMTKNKTVAATFNKRAGSSEDTAAVSVRQTGKGSGKVISITSTGKKMKGINCGNDCSENFKKYCEFEAEGNKRCGTVYFKATPDKGSTFGGWGGDCLTFKKEKDQCYVILDGDKTINANFDGDSKSDLTVAVSAGGIVKSADGNINCGSGNTDCNYTYKKNGKVTLRAIPNSGYTFQPAVDSWGSCDKMIAGTNSCQIKMKKDRNVKVEFTSTSTTTTATKYNLSIKNTGSVAGAVSLLYVDNSSYIKDLSDNISCTASSNGGKCKFSVESDKKVKIMAFANIGGYKVDWSSVGCSAQGVSNPSNISYCEITVSGADKEVEIKFSKSSSN